jgi:hypothetical protein
VARAAWSIALEPFGPGGRWSAQVRAGHDGSRGGASSATSGSSARLALHPPPAAQAARPQLHRARSSARRQARRDVLAGLGGAAIMGAAFATPFRRAARTMGLNAARPPRELPGDTPSRGHWQWTHGGEWAAPARRVAGSRGRR